MIPIVYSAATGRIRCFYELDKDESVEGIRTGKGEALHILDGNFADYVNEKDEPLLHSLQSMLNDVTGLNPTKSDDLYAVVKPDTGDIIGCLHCDPECGDKLDSLALLKRADADKLLEGHKVDETTRTKFQPGVIDRDSKDVVIIEPVKPVLPPKPTDRDVVEIDTPKETQQPIRQ